MYAYQDIRKKVARLIACKCTLAARVDSFHECPGGEIGERKLISVRKTCMCMFTHVELREEVQKKVDKLMEPPPVKAPKPLPKPDDAPRKKRGGRRQVQIRAVALAQWKGFWVDWRRGELDSGILTRHR